MISCLFIELEIEQADFEQEILTVYYCNEDESFSEDRTIRKEITPGRQVIIEINFDNSAKMIRIDPIMANGKCKINKFKIACDCQEALFENEISRKIVDVKDRERLVIVTHELSNSGAPILAYNIAKRMKESGKDVVVVSPQAGKSWLEKSYNELKIPLLIINEIISFRVSQNNIYQLTSDELLNKILRILRNKSYKTAIANTIVSGMYVKKLKEFDFKIISLIHEMKTTIKFYQFIEYGQMIARYADYIVFPNDFVKNDFYSLFKKINGESFIQAQGVYLEKNIEESLNVLEKNGLSGKTYIMSSGQCELRKGIDLFVNAALILLAQNYDIHFVWTGNFSNKELECWMMDQISRSGYEKNFHFISFIDDSKEYRTLLKNASAFWGMSREDPFPSTVLEAMDNEVPVVGFCGTGGIHIMLSDNRGVLIEHFDLQQVACQTIKLLEEEGKRVQIIEKAKVYIKSLNLDKYIAFLEGCIKSEQIISPNLDLYIWGEWKHFYTKQLKEKSLEIRTNELDVLCKKFRFTRDMKNVGDKIVLLDTAMNSDNIGDSIIMDYCLKACQPLFSGKEMIHIPTHIYDKKSENLSDYFKILCGTNLIYTRMEDSKQWALPNDISSYRNICLLGVGMQELGIDLQMSEYSKKFLNFILSSKFYHSVRDEETKNRLEEIGITNVINTGCPTMWGLTRKKCAEIPTTKSENVLTTVTDYMQDREADTYMLETLKEHYKKVYIWIQGLKDYEYLDSLVNLDDFEIVPPTLEALDSILMGEDIDYIGTRLHAGIRSLNMNHRSLVVAIDNRARAIHADTNLPIIERIDLKLKLIELIFQDRETNIKLPLEQIDKWKKQFV